MSTLQAPSKGVRAVATGEPNKDIVRKSAENPARIMLRFIHISRTRLYARGHAGLPHTCMRLAAIAKLCNKPRGLCLSRCRHSNPPLQQDSFKVSSITPVCTTPESRLE